MRSSSTSSRVPSLTSLDTSSSREENPVSQHVSGDSGHAGSRHSQRARCSRKQLESAGMSLDQVMEAYRLLDEDNGVVEKTLEEMIQGLTNPELRNRAGSQLSDAFAACDLNGDGVLDENEFFDLMQSSNLIRQAIFDFLNGQEDDTKLPSASGAKRVSFARILDSLIDVVVFVNVLQIAIAYEFQPEARLWLFIEVLFIVIYASEFVFKVNFRRLELRDEDEMNGSHTWWAGLQGGLTSYIQDRLHKLDVLILVVSSALLVLEFSLDNTMVNFTIFKAVRLIRLLRIARFARADGVVHDVRLLFKAIGRGSRPMVASLILLLANAFLLAGTLQQGVDAASDDELLMTFRSVPKGMLAIFRCLALSSDGACYSEEGVSLYKLISDGLGMQYALLWVISEFLIKCGILNMLASVFVLQAINMDRLEQQKLQAEASSADTMLIFELDALLKTLNHPHCKRTATSEAKASQVTGFIKKKHPNVLHHIPNLSQAIKKLADDIHASTTNYQSAMGAYESAEPVYCTYLKSFPSAQTYRVQGDEQLLASGKNSRLGTAPDGAVAMELKQEGTTLVELLSEAKKVQAHVKALLLPGTRWADTHCAGSSGDVWSSSNRLCDEAIDPGPKDPYRSRHKVQSKYAGNYARNRDYCRIGMIYNTIKHLLQGLDKFLHFTLEADGLKVVSIENRFAAPTSLGWRDITLLIQVLVPSASPSESIAPSGTRLRTLVDVSGRRHVMEVQLMLRDLMNARMVEHGLYQQIRSVLPDNVFTMILDRLAATDTGQHLTITKREWRQCLKQRRIRDILNALHIPEHNWKDIVEILDQDNTGFLSSLELRRGLMKCRGAAQAHETLDCKQRITSLQDVAHRICLSQDGFTQKIAAIQDDMEHILEHLSGNTNVHAANPGKEKMTRSSKRLSSDAKPNLEKQVTSIHCSYIEGVGKSKLKADLFNASKR